MSNMPTISAAINVFILGRANGNCFLFVLRPAISAAINAFILGRAS